MRSDDASANAQDFLVRSLIGFDQATGAMAIGEGVRVGQRLRFMVRDRDGAMQDLNNHALAIKRRQLQARIIWATCFAKSSQMLRQHTPWPDVPAAVRPLQLLLQCELDQAA